MLEMFGIFWVWVQAENHSIPIPKSATRTFRNMDNLTSKGKRPKDVYDVYLYLEPLQS